MAISAREHDLTHTPYYRSSVSPQGNCIVHRNDQENATEMNATAGTGSDGPASAPRTDAGESRDRAEAPARGPELPTETAVGAAPERGGGANSQGSGVPRPVPTPSSPSRDALNARSSAPITAEIDHCGITSRRCLIMLVRAGRRRAGRTPSASLSFSVSTGQAAASLIGGLYAGREPMLGRLPALRGRVSRRV